MPSCFPVPRPPIEFVLSFPHYVLQWAVATSLAQVPTGCMPILFTFLGNHKNTTSGGKKHPRGTTRVKSPSNEARAAAEREEQSQTLETTSVVVLSRGCGSKPMGPILEPIFVGIGMFTGGTIWILTRGHTS